MLVFTDGGCIGNGKPHAKSSYAVYINNTIIRGHVMPHEYILSNILTLSCNTSVHIQPSNNRGELLSLIKAFMEILNIEDTNITVYSDSQICVKTINEWYDNRLRKGTTHEFKNLDLVEIMMTLYKKIKTCKDIRVIHTRGHQKITCNMSEEQKNIINGNNIVDHHASTILLSKTLIELERYSLHNNE